MKENKLDRSRVNLWILSGSVYWAESTTQLVIRESWITYRDMILSGSPCCVNLKGKSGRGKSVFLRYLIFYILLEIGTVDATSRQEHRTNPRIAFMDRDAVLYYITKDSITLYSDRYNLVAAVGLPHFYFTDNVDVDSASAGSLVTMALSSGDTVVLKNFSKRMNEARIINRLHLIMQGLDLDEMLLVFPDLTAEEVTFKFDVVGGNPRLACARISADGMSQYYSYVKEVVDMMFPLENDRHRIWATDVACIALDNAKKNKADDALDSSTFREFVVTKFEVEAGSISYGEVFASTFMGFVASRIYNLDEETTKAMLLKLFGSAGTGVFFEYEAHMAFLKAKQDDVYNCFCQRTKTIVELCLGGGNLKLIRNIKDLELLQDGDCGIPTVSNFPIIDRALFRTTKFGLQMTTGFTHVCGVKNLPAMLTAFKVQNQEDFSIVFVVPKDNLGQFVFPTNLGNVSLYLTTSHPCSEDVIKEKCRNRLASPNRL